MSHKNHNIDDRKVVEIIFSQCPKIKTIEQTFAHNYMQ